MLHRIENAPWQGVLLRIVVLNQRCSGTRTALRELVFYEPSVGAFLLNQHLVASFLDDLSVFKNTDAVGVSHRRQPMRDYQRGAPLHQPLERVLNQVCGLRVEG